MKTPAGKRDGRLLYRRFDCLLCGARPAAFIHFPHHRGMGAGKAGWGLLEGVPGCFNCHELVDGRAGRWREHEAAVERLWAVALPFWRAVLESNLPARYYMGPDERIEAVRNERRG